MEGSFTTVVISAAVGGVAGAVFPTIKDAIKFVVLEADSKKNKLYGDMRASLKVARSRLALQKEVTERTEQISKLVTQGQLLLQRYREGTPFDDVKSELVDISLALQSQQAYLVPFDLKERLSPEAATHIATSIAFSDHMRSMLRMIRANEGSDPGVLARKEGDATKHELAMGRLIELQSALDSSLSLWIRADNDEDAKSDHKYKQMEGLVEDLKQRRKLSLGFLIGVAVFVAIAVPVLLHYQRLAILAAAH